MPADPEVLLDGTFAFIKRFPRYLISQEEGAEAPLPALPCSSLLSPFDFAWLLFQEPPRFSKAGRCR